MFGFHKKKRVVKEYDHERYEPVLRSSICTGEKTACFRNLETGKLHEILVIRTQQDLEEFGKQYGVNTENLKIIY
jgi:hypothetical protein